MIRYVVFAVVVLGLLGTVYPQRSQLTPPSLPVTWATATGDLTYGALVQKFGFNDAVADTEESIWEGNDHSSGPVRCPLDTSAFTLYISSDNGADTEDMTVQGLDANWDSISVDVTLAGITFTQVGDDTNWMRVNRAFNAGTSDLVGVVYLHKDATDGNADGIPDTPSTDIITIVNAGENQTLQSCFTVPDGVTALMTDWCYSLLGGSGATQDYIIRLRVTPESGVSQSRQKFSNTEPDSLCRILNPPIVFSARDLIEVTAIRTTGNAAGDVSGHYGLVLWP